MDGRTDAKNLHDLIRQPADVRLCDISQSDSLVDSYYTHTNAYSYPIIY